MIHGIGVDILSTSRLEKLRGEYDDPFFRKVFTKDEYLSAMGRNDPTQYFAERFAAKEAVFKALNSNSGEFRFSDVETLNDESGKPYVVLYGSVKEYCDIAGISSVLISLSSDVGYAVAFAVCEK